MAVVASRPDTGGPRADEVDLNDHRHRSGEPLVDAEKNVGRYTHSQLGAQTIMKGTGNPTSHPRTNTLIQVYFNAGLLMSSTGSSALLTVSPRPRCLLVRRTSLNWRSLPPSSCSVSVPALSW